MTADERNRVIVRSVATFLIGVVVLLTLYQLREVLMTLYISQSSGRIVGLEVTAGPESDMPWPAGTVMSYTMWEEAP